MPQVSTEGTPGPGGDTVWATIQHLHLLGCRKQTLRATTKSMETVSRCCQPMVVSRGHSWRDPQIWSWTSARPGGLSHRVRPRGRWPSTGVTMDTTAGLGKAASILGWVTLSISYSRKRPGHPAAPLGSPSVIIQPSLANEQVRLEHLCQQAFSPSRVCILVTGITYHPTRTPLVL